MQNPIKVNKNTISATKNLKIPNKNVKMEQNKQPKYAEHVKNLKNVFNNFYKNHCYLDVKNGNSKIVIEINTFISKNLGTALMSYYKPIIMNLCRFYSLIKLIITAKSTILDGPIYLKYPTINTIYGTIDFEGDSNKKGIKFNNTNEYFKEIINQYFSDNIEDLKQIVQKIQFEKSGKKENKIQEFMNKVKF